MYRAFQKARPRLASVVTGFGVMSVGDLAVQQLDSRDTDVQRNLVSSTYNGLVSPFLLAWWNHLDRVFPGVAFPQLARKVSAARAPSARLTAASRAPAHSSSARLAPFCSPLTLCGAQVVVNQVVVSALNSPLYMLWCGHVRAWLGGRTDWADVRIECADQLRRELPTVLTASFCLWIPINTINFAAVPPHLKIPFISAVSAGWGGYISHVAHR